MEAPPDRIYSTGMGCPVDATTKRFIDDLAKLLIKNSQGLIPQQVCWETAAVAAAGWRKRMDKERAKGIGLIVPKF